MEKEWGQLGMRERRGRKEKVLCIDVSFD